MALQRAVNQATQRCTYSLRFCYDSNGLSIRMPTVPENRKDLFLKACRCETVERVPVWIMRQAGRYLPEYQAIRQNHSFLEICQTPDLAAEVSLQPFRSLDVDAVIVFSDILIVAQAMGMPLEVPDSGPVLGDPIRSDSGIQRLRDFDPEIETKFVGDAIRLLCAAVGPEVPVLGFAAAPWTLACYMVEGKTRGDISIAKRMVYAQPQALRILLEKIALATARYLRSQITAGAAAVQLFDTWAGELGRAEFDEFELPAIRALLNELKAASTPVILYARGGAHLLESLKRTGVDVLSLDWRTDLAEARRSLGTRVALQGNVDPAVLLGPETIVREAARECVEKTGGVGHILNLGHGILPNTPVQNARAFVEAGKSVALPTRATMGQAKG
jgi:uroporphyrinogen decarboxylase